MWWTSGARPRVAGRFQPMARELFLAVGTTILQGALPAEQGSRSDALQQWLERLEDTVAGMPLAVQTEVDEMILILTSAPGRIGLAGLLRPWGQATAAELQAVMQDLRLSRLPLRQQVFHALRDLSNAAYFAAPQTWAAVGYPGPLKV